MTLIVAIVLYFVVPNTTFSRSKSTFFNIVTPPDEHHIVGKRTSKGEEACREVLQEVFGMPFPSIRPDFLRNPKTGKNLELDCYNATLKLAVEYNGRQHYAYTNHFHRDDTDQFVSQVDRDEFKSDRCKQLGITLINVPYTVPNALIDAYLLKKLYKKGFGRYMREPYKKDVDIV